VSHSFGLAEDDLEIGILLVDGEDLRDGRFVLYKALKGVTASCKGVECHVGVPLVKDIGHHLGRKEESSHLIGGADILDGTIFETGDVIDYFCHI
jgi:predicted Zn-dependent protease with MMP-like domain